MTVTCPVNDTVGICDTMDSAGAGLGVFLQYLVAVLPGFLIILAIVGVIGAIGWGIASLLGKSIGGSHRYR